MVDGVSESGDDGAGCPVGAAFAASPAVLDLVAGGGPTGRSPGGAVVLRSQPPRLRRGFGRSPSLWSSLIGTPRTKRPRPDIFPSSRAAHKDEMAVGWRPSGQANRTGLNIGVSHFPPSTSKWNKIEHRLFCHITDNWRGRPLVDHETVVQLIGSVRTKTGLIVKAKLDTRLYPTGVEVADEEMEGLNITRDRFHGEWNYAFAPSIRRAA